MLTAECLRELLHYDPETGVFTRRVRDAGKAAGWLNYDGYPLIWLGRRHYRAHRLAWLYMTGEWPKRQIDHIDGHRANNRWLNLREATQTMNNMNSRLSVANSSGFKGVSWRKSRHKWVAHIRINKKLTYLGSFDSPEEAFIEYCFAGWRHFGDFFKPDADYIRIVKKHKAREALEHNVLWNLARPDPNYMAMS
jgi:hypothetical protein